MEKKALAWKENTILKLSNAKEASKKVTNPLSHYDLNFPRGPVISRQQQEPSTQSLEERRVAELLHDFILSTPPTQDGARKINVETDWIAFTSFFRSKVSTLMHIPGPRKISEENSDILQWIDDGPRRRWVRCKRHHRIRSDIICTAARNNAHSTKVLNLSTATTGPAVLVAESTEEYGSATASPYLGPSFPSPAETSCSSDVDSRRDNWSRVTGEFSPASLLSSSQPPTISPSASCDTLSRIVLLQQPAGSRHLQLREAEEEYGEGHISTEGISLPPSLSLFSPAATSGPTPRGPLGLVSPCGNHTLGMHQPTRDPGLTREIGVPLSFLAYMLFYRLALQREFGVKLTPPKPFDPSLSIQTMTVTAHKQSKLRQVIPLLDAFIQDPDSFLGPLQDGLSRSSKLYVYVDNANISIGANLPPCFGFDNKKQTKGIYANNVVTNDNCASSSDTRVYASPVRLNCLAISRLLCGGRSCMDKVIYGSKPSLTKPLLEDWVEQGFKVRTPSNCNSFNHTSSYSFSPGPVAQGNGVAASSRGARGTGEVREKTFTARDLEEVIVKEIQQTVLSQRGDNVGDRRTLVLVTGDGRVSSSRVSFPELVQQALMEGWSVELWTWQACMSGLYRAIFHAHNHTRTTETAANREQQPTFKVYFFDHFREDVTIPISKTSLRATTAASSLSAECTTVASSMSPSDHAHRDTSNAGDHPHSLSATAATAIGASSGAGRTCSASAAVEDDEGDACVVPFKNESSSNVGGPEEQQQPEEYGDEDEEEDSEMRDDSLTSSEDNEYEHDRNYGGL